MSTLAAAWRTSAGWWGSTGTAPMVLRRALVAVLSLVVIQRVFALSPAEIVGGLALGSLYGVIGVALVLSYRTSRVINFAAAAVGAVPAITAVLVSIAYHVSYLLTLPLAVIGGAAFGAATERLVLRRFAHSSRLLVTVVTIGVAQSFSALGFFIPDWFGENVSAVPRVTTPWQNIALHNSRGEPVVSGNQIFAFVVVIVATGALAYFLKRTRYGIALRATAENGERAALLGVPVNTISMTAWALAGVLSALAVFSQAPLIGVPSDATLGFDTLLYGLAAAVVAKMENVGLSLLTGLGIGLLIAGSVLKTGTDDYASALMLVVILVGLLGQRRSLSRARDLAASSWQAVTVFRPIPVELRALPEVVRARAGLVVAGLGLAVLLPFVVGSANLTDLQTLPIYGIVGVSLVVLTGWAGQISLGQFGLVGMAGAVAGGLIARHNIDFFAALALGIATGAVTAVIVGLPALRINGLYLAVTTLAFGYAMQSYVLNQNYLFGAHLLPGGYAASIRRPMLYGKFNLELERPFYFLCLGLFVLCLLAAMSFRRHHSGRVLIALRDNQRAAASYAIAPASTRLAAFAIAGGFCGVAGVLTVYQQHNVIPGSFSVTASIAVFLAASIGGLGSLATGVGSVVAFEAAVLFGPMAWNSLGPTFVAVMPLLLTGPLLVANLYLNPGGLAGAVFSARDDWLRRLARRHEIHVPALLADRRVVDPGFAVPVASAPRSEEFAGQGVG